MAVVWIVQEPAQRRNKTTGLMLPVIDVTPAKDFGLLKYLLGWSEAKGLTGQEMSSIIADRLEEYQDGDWILMIGNPTAMAVAAMIASYKGNTLRLLLWDRVEKKYKRAIVNIQLLRERHGLDTHHKVG